MALARSSLGTTRHLPEPPAYPVLRWANHRARGARAGADGQGRDCHPSLNHAPLAIFFEVRLSNRLAGRRMAVLAVRRTLKPCARVPI